MAPYSAAEVRLLMGGVLGFVATDHCKLAVDTSRRPAHTRSPALPPSAQVVPGGIRCLYSSVTWARNVSSTCFTIRGNAVNTVVGIDFLTSMQLAAAPMLFVRSCQTHHRNSQHVLYSKSCCRQVWVLELSLAQLTVMGIACKQLFLCCPSLLCSGLAAALTIELSVTCTI